MNGLIKKGNRTIGLLSLVCLVVVILLAVFIYNIPNLYAYVERGRVEEINRDFAALLAATPDAQRDEVLAQFADAETLELAVVGEDNYQFSTVATTDFAILENLLDPDALSYHSIAEMAGNGHEYQVWIAVYQAQPQLFFEIAMGIVTVGIIVFSVVISLLALAMFRRLVRPLKRLRSNIFHLRDYDLDAVGESGNAGEYDVLSDELSEFSHDLQGRITNISSNYTRLEKQLQIRQEQNVYTNQMIGAMVHQMKTPLHVVLLEVGKLRQEFGDSPVAETELGRMETSAQALLGEINNTLKIINSETDETAIVYSEFDVVALTRDIVRLFFPLFIERGISMMIDAPRELLIYSSEIHLRQILHNMISNGCHYADAGGEFEVQIYEADGEVILSAYNDKQDVSGIDFEHIFDLFYRAESSENLYGSGVGLFTVKNMVEDIGGSCSFRAVGNGVELQVRIPLRANGEA